MSDLLLTDEIRALVGRTCTYAAPDPVGAASIRYFATATGDDNPLYSDDDYARQQGYPSVIAPPTFICESNQFVVRQRDRNGYAGHTWGIEIPGCRNIRGGNKYTFSRPVLPTDVVTTTWTVIDVSERTTSDGDPMIVIVSEAVYTNQDAEHLATNRETLIFRRVRR